MKYGQVLFFFALMFGMFAGKACSEEFFTPKTNKQLIKTSVTITNMEESSGGSGSIFRSGPKGSFLLTNAHVCRVAEHGGKVITQDKKKFIILPHNIKPYKDHDLCLIKIFVDLKINLKLARHAPAVGDDAIVVGHPNLLPVTITKGHFSDLMPITLMDGSRPCTEEEKKDPKIGMLCMMNDDKFPLVVTREALYMSPTIMAGSSGSPVFNDRGELAAVIFAGKGGDGLSYAWAVPTAYLWSFLGKY